MIEYRCTRPDLYSPGSIGHDNYRARQGHYIRAETPDEAARIMLRDYPEDSAVDVQIADSDNDYLSQPQRYHRI